MQYAEPVLMQPSPKQVFYYNSVQTEELMNAGTRCMRINKLIKHSINQSINQSINPLKRAYYSVPTDE